MTFAEDAYARLRGELRDIEGQLTDAHTYAADLIALLRRWLAAEDPAATVAEHEQLVADTEAVLG